MRTIEKADIQVNEIIESCISTYRSENLKERFIMSMVAVHGETETFTRLAKINKYDELIKNNLNGACVTKVEFKKLYEEKFVGQKHTRSKYYDKIMVMYGYKCPICDIRNVSQLDHYMPKSVYPMLAVSIENLYPICSDCNKVKLDKIFSNNIDRPFHPYFDQIEHEEWLICDIKIEFGKIISEFKVNSEIRTWDPDLYQRLNYNLKLFSLNKLYSIESNSEINNKKFMWEYVYRTSGEAGLLSLLQLELQSLKRAKADDWRISLGVSLIKNIAVIKDNIDK